MVKGLKLDSPNAIFKILISVVVGSALIVALYPTIVSNLASIGSLDNFTFASFFQSGGVVFIILAIAVLIGAFALIGIKMGGKR